MSELPITENRIEKLLLICFLLSFLFGQLENCVVFGSHCITSAYTHDNESKLNTETNFDTLIPNLKLNFQYDIVMTS